MVDAFFSRIFDFVRQARIAQELEAPRYVLIGREHEVDIAFIPDEGETDERQSGDDGDRQEHAASVVPDEIEGPGEKSINHALLPQSWRSQAERSKGCD